MNDEQKAAVKQWIQANPSLLSAITSANYATMASVYNEGRAAAFQITEIQAHEAMLTETK